MAGKNNIDFTEGSIFKKLVAFTFPLILTGLLQHFYGTADQIVIGRMLGKWAMAAVGATGSITGMILVMFTSLSVGVTVMCAKYCGAKDEVRTQNTVHTAVCIALIGGAIPMIIGIVLARPLLMLTSVPADIIENSVKYMKVVFLGQPFSMLFNFCAGALRARGDTKRPLYILMITGLINVILNALFILLGMEVIGVALSTVISQVLSAISIVYMMTRSDDMIRIDLKKIRIHTEELRAILRIGIPAGLNGMLYTFTGVLVQSGINAFGTVYIAANSAASDIIHYISLTHTAISNGMVSFAGQNHGAGNYSRIKKAIVYDVFIALAIGIGAFIIIVLFPNQLLGIFTNEQAVIEAGKSILIIMAFAFILNGPLNVFGGVLRGVEKPNIPFVTGLIAVCGSRVLWLKFLFPLYPKFEMIFYSYPLSVFLAMLAQGTTALYFVNKYEKQRKNETLADSDNI